MAQQPDRGPKGRSGTGEQPGRGPDMEALAAFGRSSPSVCARASSRYERAAASGPSGQRRDWLQPWRRRRDGATLHSSPRAPPSAEPVPLHRAHWTRTASSTAGRCAPSRRRPPGPCSGKTGRRCRSPLLPRMHRMRGHATTIGVPSREVVAAGAHSRRPPPLILSPHRSRVNHGRSRGPTALHEGELERITATPLCRSRPRAERSMDIDTRAGSVPEHEQ